MWASQSVGGCGGRDGSCDARDGAQFDPAHVQCDATAEQVVVVDSVGQVQWESCANRALEVSE